MAMALVESKTSTQWRSIAFYKIPTKGGKTKPKLIMIKPAWIDMIIR
jgi:hypothetical protein